MRSFLREAVLSVGLVLLMNSISCAEVEVRLGGDDNKDGVADIVKLTTSVYELELNTTNYMGYIQSLRLVKGAGKNMLNADLLGIHELLSAGGRDLRQPVVIKDSKFKDKPFFGKEFWADIALYKDKSLKEVVVPICHHSYPETNLFKAPKGMKLELFEGYPYRLKLTAQANEYFQREWCLKFYEDRIKVESLWKPLKGELYLGGNGLIKGYPGNMGGIVSLSIPTISPLIGQEIKDNLLTMVNKGNIILKGSVWDQEPQGWQWRDENRRQMKIEDAADIVDIYNPKVGEGFTLLYTRHVFTDIYGRESTDPESHVFKQKSGWYWGCPLYQEPHILSSFITSPLSGIEGESFWEEQNGIEVERGFKLIPLEGLRTAYFIVPHKGETIPGITVVEKKEKPEVSLWKSPVSSTALEIPLNGEWEYYALEEDKGYSELGEKWSKTYVPVAQYPHLPFCKYDYSWFRREFEIPSEWKGKKIKLIFGGLDMEGEVWINNEFVDKHIIGWAPYKMDITKQVNFSETNILAVKVSRYPKVDGKEIAFSPFYQRRGIYEEVKLEAHPSIYGDDIYIITSVREKKITLQLKLINETNTDQKATIEANVIDEARVNPLVKTLPPKEVVLKPDSSEPIEISCGWDNPRYWTISDPYLYNLKIRVKSKEGIDEHRIRFGFREFWVENGHFYLNGRKIRGRGSVLDDLETTELLGMRALIRTLKSQGWNHFRRWVGSRLVYRLADEEGILLDACEAGCPYSIAAKGQQPITKYYEGFEGKLCDICDDITSRFIKGMRNHPSIVMWSLDNEFVIVKSGKRFERMKGLKRLANIYSKIDPIRPLLTYGDAAADDEPEFSVENIHDYSDVYHFWPVTMFGKIEETSVLGGRKPRKQFGKKPLMFGEFSGISQGRGAGNAEIVYLGEEAVRNPDSIEKLAHLIRKRLLRSWRIYGVNGLRACGRMYGYMFTPAGPIPRIKANWGYLDSPIPHPEIFRHPWGGVNAWVSDVGEVKLNGGLGHGLGKGFYDGYKPVVATCANQWDWSYFSGERVEKRIYALNDNYELRDIDAQIIWKVKDGDNILAQGEDKLKVGSGSNGEVLVAFTLPEYNERRKLEFCVYLKESDRIIDENSYDLEVFPNSYRKKPEIKEKVALYDPKGITKRVLEEAEVKFKLCDSISKLSGYDLFVIGTDVPVKELVKNREVIADYVNKGGKVLVFEQPRALNITPTGLKVGTFFFNQAFPRVIGHPVFKELKDEDLRMWRGDPNLVSSYPLHKPSFIANYKSIVHAGPGLDYTALLEYYHGKGMYLFCQMDVSKRYGTDPVAGKLVNNILEYMDSLGKKRWAKVALLEGEAKLMGKILDGYEVLGKKLSRMEILVIGPGSDCRVLEEKKEEIERFVRDGGKVICLHQGPDSGFDYEWLPQSAHIVRKELTPRIFEALDSQVMEGISLYDLSPRYEPLPSYSKGYTGGNWARSFTHFVKDPFVYWGSNYKVLAGIPISEGWAKPAGISGAAILELTCGKGSYILVQIPFEELLEKTEKARFVLAGLLTNLGVRVKEAPFIAASKDIISLEGNWLFQWDPENAGEKEGWQRDNYDDTKWGIMDVLCYWEAGIPIPDYDGYGWYRMHVVIPEEWKGKEIHLRVGSIDDCDWTYLNGKLVGSISFADPSRPASHLLVTPTSRKEVEGHPCQAFRDYIVPKEHVKFGEDNVIAVKVYDEKGGGGIYNGPVDLKLGN